MDNKEIFLRIIKKAEKGGYKDHLKMLPILPITRSSADLLVKKIFWQKRYEIMFSHNFAKAFWGEELRCYICDKTPDEGHSIYCSKKIWCEPADKPKWKYRLQEMVLEKEPIEYLKHFLDKE